MKGFLYPRLALSGIKKNFRFYLPFLFACVGMMMVFYITAFLANSNFVAQQPGGEMISVVLRLGWIILAAFSAIFLFYTSSFLTKRRKKEFGMYNILGMSKGNITAVLLFENLFILVITLLVGISLGVLFSKFVEILLINMIGGTNSLDFYVDWSVIKNEVLIYAALFAMILLKSYHQVYKSSAIKLLKSKSEGEKPPKANIAAAIIGAVLLIAGYVLANIVKNPVYAILAFFGAVVLVIAATFLLFISGSVVVCKLLKKNKKYYYKTNHFVSTSQMAFRMKRNGAGLASICVLACMALFTIISTSGLYFGSAQIMRRMYPRDLTFQLVSDNQKIVDELGKIINETALENNANPHDFVTYRYLHSDAEKYRNKKMLTDEDYREMTQDEYNELYNTCPTVEFYLIPISEYNSIMGTNLTVNKGEALILKLQSEPKNETYDVIPVRWYEKIQTIGENGKIIYEQNHYTDLFKCVGTVDDFVVMDGDHLNELVYTDVNNYHYRYAFINDEDFETQYQRKLENKYTYYRVGSRIFHNLDEIDMNSLEPDEKVFYANEPTMFYYFGTDLDCNDQTLFDISRSTFRKAHGFFDEHNVDEVDGKLYIEDTRMIYDSVSETRSHFFAMFSGLFFLGVLFCIVFVLAAVMIMYYKQVTEGFEDKSRFEILQKVGMTKAEIRSSINSQVLTLFFTPLLVAGVHIAFAFPLIVKLLMMFGQMDVVFLILVSVICFVLYSAVYVLAYVLTSKSNYRIVAR